MNRPKDFFVHEIDAMKGMQRPGRLFDRKSAVFFFFSLSSQNQACNFAKSGSLNDRGEMLVLRRKSYRDDR